MVYDEVGEVDVRSQVFDSAVKQIASRAYKWKQLCSVVSSSSWKNYFFREQLAQLSGPSGNAIKGIPRGAEFPQASLSWERVLTTIEKYGLEDVIPYEDIISNEIDVRDRTLMRIGEGVAKAVDDEIKSVITTDSDIQTGTLSAGYWNETSGAIIKDLAKMKAQVKTYYDNPEGFVLVIHPDAEPEVLHYIYEKGSQATTAGQSAFNGQVGSPAGVNIITSLAQDASYATLVVPKRCATWKELVPLSTDIQERKFKDTKITACEMGVTQVTDPKTIVHTQILV